MKAHPHIYTYRHRPTQTYTHTQPQTHVHVCPWVRTHRGRHTQSPPSSTTANIYPIDINWTTEGKLDNNDIHISSGFVLNMPTPMCSPNNPTCVFTRQLGIVLHVYTVLDVMFCRNVCKEFALSDNLYITATANKWLQQANIIATTW